MHAVEFVPQRPGARILRDQKNTLTEIAYLLGYAEVSAFNRAFKRWTRATPSEYRRGMASRSGGTIRADSDSFAPEGCPGQHRLAATRRTAASSQAAFAMK